MNIRDIIDRAVESVREGRSIDEVIDSEINSADFATHTAILDELGDVDLSEPAPDLSAGWPRVRQQLAYNALYRAVIAEVAEDKPRTPATLQERFPVGARVRVVASDLPVYVGKTGTVTDYDTTPGETLLVGVTFDEPIDRRGPVGIATRDGFYDDEIEVTP